MVGEGENLFEKHDWTTLHFISIVRCRAGERYSQSILLSRQALGEGRLAIGQANKKVRLLILTTTVPRFLVHR